jgi:hypothetical protein
MPGTRHRWRSGGYDRYSFLEEKRIAFENLAGLIERIVSPQSNVVPVTKR